MAKALGRVFAKRIQDIPEDTFKQILKCNYGPGRGLMYGYLRHAQMGIIKNAIIGYCMLKGQVIAAGGLFRQTNRYEYMTYTKVGYRNLGVAKRIFNAVVPNPTKVKIYVDGPKVAHFYRSLGADIERNDLNGGRPWYMGSYKIPNEQTRRQIKQQARERVGLI